MGKDCFGREAKIGDHCYYVTDSTINKGKIVAFDTMEFCIRTFGGFLTLVNHHLVAITNDNFDDLEDDLKED